MNTHYNFFFIIHCIQNYLFIQRLLLIIDFSGFLTFPSSLFRNGKRVPPNAHQRRTNKEIQPNKPNQTGKLSFTFV